MSTQSREVIFGSGIRGAKIHADGARERAKQVVRDADRAEAEAWSIQIEGYGGPAQPSPTIGECLNGGLSVPTHSSSAGVNNSWRWPRAVPFPAMYLLQEVVD